MKRMGEIVVYPPSTVVDSTRYTEDEVFSRVRGRIHERKTL